MKPSTLLELVGFAALSYAAYQWNHLVGFVAIGLCCLLIAYAMEDATAGAAIVRMLTPVKVRRLRLELRLQNRRTRRHQSTRRRFHRSPAEVVVRVERD